MTASNPLPPVAEGVKRAEPQTTVRPCSNCRPAQHRRWLNGHFPCPKIRGLCDECKRVSGTRTTPETEHLPTSQGDPTVDRYEPERDQQEHIPF